MTMPSINEMRDALDDHRRGHRITEWERIADRLAGVVRRVVTAAESPAARPAAIDAAHLERQRAWSRETFGPAQRTAGVIDHIRRELVEVEASPEDVTEWADVVILALDGAWRAGHEPQSIIDAVVAKQARNEQRTWPDWRTADPTRAIEHVREAAQ